MSRYVGTRAMLGLVLTPLMAVAAEPAAFVLQASGFEDGIVANEHGRLVQDWPGKPQLLVPGRWVAVDFESKRSVWFDDAGQVSLRGPYVEIRQGAFERHADDPDPRPIFSVWSKAGTALLHADGGTFLDWQPERGDWARTAHPQRYSWRSRTAGERLFDQNGKVRLQLLPNEMRASGPFEGRTDYLVCDMSDQGACALRAEDGATLPALALDGVLPLQDGSWLGRQGNAWRHMDASGQLAGDQARIYTDRGYFARLREWADDEVTSWPRWMTEYHIHRNSDNALVVQEDSATHGLMQADGNFVPVPGASAAREVCPGVWRFAMKDGDRLGGGDGQLGARIDDYAWAEIESRPDLRVSIADNSHKTLIDCQGRRVVDLPALSGLTSDGVGFIGTLADEDQPRLWLDAALKTHLLPEGSRIEASSADGSLLSVRDAQGGMRLFNVAHQRFVGSAVTDMEALLTVGAVFFRDGYYGFMDSDGNERLSPQYNTVLPWGADRLWTSRHVEAGGESRTQVTLHRLDGSVVARWMDATLSTSPMLRDLPGQGPVAELLGSTVETAQGSYFGQQWVDREGRTLFLAVHCQGASRDAEGGVIEPLQGKPRYHGAPCAIPDVVRASMARQPEPAP